jgi:pre-mRNA-processing factor 39
VAAVGLDFGSHAVWEKYIDFETANAEFTRVGEIFVRVLGTPLDQIAGFWDRFRLHALGRPVADLLTPDELAALAAARQPGQEEQADQNARKAMMEAREKRYQATVAESNLRKGFEQIVLKRPYFHVKPMADVYLVNWRKYLEWEESRPNNHARIVKLYERCLVAACLYLEFWTMYVAYLERTGSTDEARDVLRRGATVFHKRRPELYLQWAFFEEAHGSPDKAREAYTKLLERLPGHVEGVVRFAAFERRQGQLDEATQVYQRGIAQVAATDPKANAFLTQHLCRHLAAAGKDLEARVTFLRAVAEHGSLKLVWDAAIAFEMMFVRGPEKNAEAEQRVHDLYVRAIFDAPLSEADKRELWDRWAEFAADWGSDIDKFREIDNKIALLKKGGRPTRPHSENATSTTDTTDATEQQQQQQQEQQEQPQPSEDAPPAKVQRMMEPTVILIPNPLLQQQQQQQPLQPQQPQQQPPPPVTSIMPAQMMQQLQAYPGAMPQFLYSAPPTAQPGFPFAAAFPQQWPPQ